MDIPSDTAIINDITEKAQSFFKMPWRDKADVLIDGAIHIGLRIIAVVAIFIVCRWLIRRIDRLIDRIFVSRHVDSSLNTFIRSMLKIMAYIILAIVVVSILGIKTTSFVAVLASAAFAVGMALSGTLQNFAGGIMILLLKPFRVGDYIQAQTQEGTVKEIKLFSTILITADNKTIIVPNGGLSTSIVNNFSQAGSRRAEWTFGISYGSDYDTAKKVIEELLKQDPRVLDSPPFFIAVNALNPNGMVVIVRAWVKSDDLWDVYFDMNEKVYKIFPVHGLTLINNDMNVNLREARESKSKTAKKPDQPTAAEIKKSVSSVSCENNTKSADNSITAQDIEYPKNAPAGKASIIQADDTLADADGDGTQDDGDDDGPEGDT